MTKEDNFSSHGGPAFFSSHGGPAFPLVYDDLTQRHVYSGITIRDFFAAKAMQGWLTKYPDDMSDHRAAAGAHAVAGFAYAMADAMLSQREKS